MGLGITSALNGIQTTLSFLGMTPVFGAVFDIVNAGISIGRVNYVDAGFNVASAIPGIGDFAAGTKLVGAGAAAYGGYRAYNAISHGVSASRAPAMAANGGGRANTLVHNGLEVRAVRDLGHIDDSTLGAMAKNGFAPRTINGDKIVLHHHQQNPAGFIVEMPAKNHSIGNRVQHPFGSTPGAGLSAEQRTAFDSWRVDYWRTRAQTEIQRRAGQ